MTNLRCMDCKHIMSELDAIDDAFCPECMSEALWETSQLTSEQEANELADAEAEFDAFDIAYDMEPADARRKRFAREFTDGLVTDLVEIMGGAR